MKNFKILLNSSSTIRFLPNSGKEPFLDGSRHYFENRQLFILKEESFDSFYVKQLKTKIKHSTSYHIYGIDEKGNIKIFRLSPEIVNRIKQLIEEGKVSWCKKLINEIYSFLRRIWSLTTKFIRKT